MSVELACTCDGLPPHSHVYRVGVDPSRDGTTHITMIPDPYDVRIWVDWREVSKQLIMDGARSGRD